MVNEPNVTRQTTMTSQPELGKAGHPAGDRAVPMLEIVGARHTAGGVPFQALLAACRKDPRTP